MFQWHALVVRNLELTTEKGEIHCQYNQILESNQCE